MLDFFTKLIDTILNLFFGKVTDSHAAATEATPLPITEAGAPEIEQTADFNEAADFVGVSEGGYSNHPDDKGGPTNMGITIATLSKYLGHTATIAEVKALTKDVALKIYKKDYWDPLNLDHVIDQGVATQIFSIGMLCGTGIAAKFTQEICKVKVDLKIGDKTIAALNAYNGDTFIREFCVKTKQRFVDIITKDPTQKVFFEGWNNREDKIVKTFTEDQATVPKSPATLPGEDVGQGLVKVAVENGLDGAKMQELIDFQKKNKPGSNPRYWALCKLTAHSKTKRLAVFDRQEQTVALYLVAGGKKSDPDYDGWSTIFSNVNGSNCSSLGIGRGAEFYQMAGHGTAMRIDGLSPTNSNMRTRGCVMHKALGGPPPYVSDAFVKANGKCGRSLGCPAVDPNVKDLIIGQLRNGSLINFY